MSVAKLRDAVGKLDAQMVLVLAVFATIFGLAAMPLDDPDFWFHLRTGQYLWQERSFPQIDPFSYTAPDARPLQLSWLSDLAIFGLEQTFGDRGPILFFAMVITAAYAILYLTIRRAGINPTLASVAVALAAAASAHTWAAVPKAWAILFAAAFLCLLDLFQRGHRWAVWPIPGLMLFWVNLHGSSLVGIVILFTSIVGAAITYWLRAPSSLPPKNVGALLIATSLSIVALGINPDGWHNLVGALQHLGSGLQLAFIQEWQSPNFQLPQLKFYEFLLLSLLVLFPLSGRLPSATDLLLLLGATVLSLQSARHIPFFALVAAPLWAQHLRWTWQRFRQGGSAPSASASPGPTRGPKLWFAALNWLLLAAVAASLGWRLNQNLSVTANQAAEQRSFPSEAVAFLQQEQLPGNMFNSYNWGGYLIWRLYPTYKVFIDGRAYLYDGSVLRDYLAAYFAQPDWREVFERYDIRLVLVERAAPISTVLAEASEWRQAYTDGQATMYVRQDSDEAVKR